MDNNVCVTATLKGYWKSQNKVSKFRFYNRKSKIVFIIHLFFIYRLIHNIDENAVVKFN